MQMLDRTIPPAIHHSGILSMPDAETMILDNGVRLVSYSGGNSDVNRIVVALAGGTCEEEIAGMGRLEGLCSLDGAGLLGAAEIAELLDFNGSWASSSVETHFMLRQFCSLNNRVDELLPVMADIVTAPRFPEQEVGIACEKAARTALLNAGKVSFIARRRLGEIVMGHGCPMSRTPDPAELRSLTGMRLYENYMRRLSPAAMTVFLSGKIDDVLRRRVADTFGCLDLCAPGVPSATFRFEQASQPGVEHVRHQGALQSAIAVALPTIGRNHPDYDMLRIAVVFLGGYFGSRLMANVREDKGYTYGINAWLSGYPEVGLVGISTECDNSYVDAVINEIRREVKRLHDPESYTTDEVSRARSHMSSELASMTDTPFTVMDYHQSSILSGFPPDYFDRRQKALADMTPELIADVARRYLDPEGLFVVVAGE